MAIGVRINVYGATRLRDSTKKLVDTIEQNTMKGAEKIGLLLQDRIVRNSLTMIPHKYSSTNRMNGGNVIPLSKSINLVRTKQRQYSILVPQYAIYLDQGSGVRAIYPGTKKMRFIDQEKLNYIFMNKPIIHPGNQAYYFITSALTQSQKIAEEACNEILKENQRFYK
jgi:hypothetical protein